MNQSKANSILQPIMDKSVNSENIVGKIMFLGTNGKIVEIMDCNNSKMYLNTIKEELLYNPGGFKYQTLTENAEIRKAVDDLLYGHFGLDNPNSLKDYQKRMFESQNPNE